MPSGGTWTGLRGKKPPGYCKLMKRMCINSRVGLDDLQRYLKVVCFYDSIKYSVFSVLYPLKVSHTKKSKRQ